MSASIRRLCAIGVVLVLVLAPVGIQCLIDGYEDAIGQKDQLQMIVSNGLYGTADPNQVLDQIERQVSYSIDVPSGAFLDEIGIPLSAEAFRFDQGALVFGFELMGQSQEVLEQITEQWARLDWVAVPLGGLCGATYVKDRGVFRWMLVTCTQVGDQVCVVGRLLRAQQ